MVVEKNFYQEFLKKLAREVGEWEHSAYYIADEELFDIERFLEDHKALEIKAELERLYGKPLNYKFWHSFLAYHRLRKIRAEIKKDERQQEEKRMRYQEAVKAYRKAWNDWVEAWIREERKKHLKVISLKKESKPE